MNKKTKIKYAPILLLKQGEIDAVCRVKNKAGFSPIFLSTDDNSDKLIKKIRKVSCAFEDNYFFYDQKTEFSNCYQASYDFEGSSSNDCIICDYNDDKLDKCVPNNLRNKLIINFGHIGSHEYKSLKEWVINSDKFNKSINQNWETIIITSASFPSSDKMQKGEDCIHRYEYKIYEEIKKKNPNVVYSDCGVQYLNLRLQDPDLGYFDPKTMRPAAKVSYSLENKYYTNKGSRFTDNPSQFIDMAKKLTEKDFFRGADFSWGDKKIFDKAMNKDGTGNLTTWKSYGMSQHFEYVLSIL